MCQHSGSCFWLVTLLTMFLCLTSLSPSGYFHWGITLEARRPSLALLLSVTPAWHAPVEALLFAPLATKALNTQGPWKAWSIITWKLPATTDALKAKAWGWAGVVPSVCLMLSPPPLPTQPRCPIRFAVGGGQPWRALQCGARLSTRAHWKTSSLWRRQVVFPCPRGQVWATRCPHQPRYGAGTVAAQEAFAVAWHKTTCCWLQNCLLNGSNLGLTCIPGRKSNKWAVFCLYTIAFWSWFPSVPFWKKCPHK